jgi:NAD(P)-dependent dehydrogenase (short-subunit alcohol dehydrogenase family)
MTGGHAVITGGAGGIGLAIARALAGAGHPVTLMGRSQGSLAAAARSLAGAGFAVCDVTDDASVASALALAESERGPVQILINNAGAAATGPFEKISLDAWTACLEVNLLGAVRMTKAALPSLRTHDWARIVNVASTAGLKPYVNVSPYVAAKHALIGLTRTLALELAKTGVTVNAVAPGYTRTAIIERAIDHIAERTGNGRPAGEAFFTAANPQGRLVSPGEVATAVAWLTSREAGAINGAVLSVSGGETA